MTQISHERIAIFPGSFNPFTVGHASIVERGLQLFDRVIVAIGVSADKPSADIQARLAPIERLYRDNERVEVMTYSGLTVDLAHRLGARFFLRGIRGAADFEYERSLADANRRIGDIETVFLSTLPELSMVSSSLVRELQRYGRDAGEFLPGEAT